MINKKIIGIACKSILKNADKELYTSTQEKLENYWFFKFDVHKSIESNLYEFTQMIELYRYNCRRWEEYHNGHVEVVERVRDKYLIPKIKEFIKSTDLNKVLPI